MLVPDEYDADRLISGWVARKDDKNRYVDARDGDDLLVSFECNFCIFRKLYDRDPNPGLEMDTLSMACIRWANLDSFWSRARSTVRSNTMHRKFREGLRQSYYSTKNPDAYLLSHCVLWLIVEIEKWRRPRFCDELEIKHEQERFISPALCAAAAS